MAPSTSTYARLSRALLMFAALGAVALIVAVAQGLISERDNEIENARRRTQNLTLLLEEQARQTLRRVQWVLDEAARDGSVGAELPLAATLMHHVEQDGLVVGLVWLDAEGNGQLINRQGASRITKQGERDFVAAHRSSTGMTLAIGAPITDLMPGARLLPMSRRLSGPQGEYAGVLVALLNPRVLQPVYDAIDTGKNGGVALFLRSGWIAVRSPHVDATLAKRWDQTPMFQEHLPRARTGTVRQVVVADKVDRFYSYRELEDYPVVVYLGLSVDDVLTPWRSRAAVAVVLLALVLAAAAWGVWSLLRRLSQHEADAAALAAGERFVQRVADNLPLRVAYIDAERRYRFVNDAHARYMGLPRPQVIGLTRQQITGTTLGNDVDRSIELALGGQTQRFEFDEAGGEGQLRTFEGCLVPDVDDAGRVAGIYALAIDITERRAAQAALADQAELQRVTLRSIADAVITTDAHGIVQFMNPVAEQLCGWPLAEAQGHPVSQVFCLYDEDSGEPLEHPVTRCLADAVPVAAGSAALLLSREGRQISVQDLVAPIRDTGGVVKGAVLVFRDVTQERRKSAELAYRASHDGLTGLVNRAEFELRLARMLQQQAEGGGEHALMFIDLDHFKQVNDSAGHLAGDRLLCRVANMLQHSVRSRDTVGRLGGDEFVVLLEQCPFERARELAQTLCERVHAIDFVHGGRSFRIGASIGLVKLEPGCGDAAMLLQGADAACYAAKAAGRNRVHQGLMSAADERSAPRH